MVSFQVCTSHRSQCRSAGVQPVWTFRFRFGRILSGRKIALRFTLSTKWLESIWYTRKSKELSERSFWLSFRNFSSQVDWSVLNRIGAAHADSNSVADTTTSVDQARRLSSAVGIDSTSPKDRLMRVPFVVTRLWLAVPFTCSLVFYQDLPWHGRFKFTAKRTYDDIIRHIHYGAIQLNLFSTFFVEKTLTPPYRILRNVTLKILQISRCNIITFLLLNCCR